MVTEKSANAGIEFVHFGKIATVAPDILLHTTTTIACARPAIPGARVIHNQNRAPNLFGGQCIVSATARFVVENSRRKP